MWSLLHADDAAGAFVAATERPRSGVWHVVDDRPVPYADFLSGIARRIGATPPRRMPRTLARLVLGPYVSEILTASFKTTNARFCRDFGWRPRFPTFEEGLDAVVADWRGEGFLPPRRGDSTPDWYRSAILVVAAHFAVLVVHTAAHFALEIVPQTLDLLLILLVFFALPIASVALFGKEPRTAWVLLVAFTITFAYGGLSHYAFSGPDNALGLTPDTWSVVFQATTVALAGLEGLGIVVGLMLVARTRTPSVPAARPG